MKTSNVNFEILLSMKRLLLFIFFICASCQAFAQTDSINRISGTQIDIRLDKGHIMVGGTLGLDLKDAENENQLLRKAALESKDVFTLRIDGAYAIKHDVFAGIGFLWGNTNREGDYIDPNTGDISNIRYHSSSYSFRPFVKNHLPLDRNRRFNIVIQTELGFSLEQSIEETTTGDIVTRQLSTTQKYGVGLRPGLLAFLVRNFGVEASVNLAGIGYSIQKSTQTGQPDSWVNTADLSLKIDLLQLNLGFVTYF